MIFIQSKRDGFRRCGVAHLSKGKEFEDDFFTEEQLEILNNDPQIVMVAGVDIAGSDKKSGSSKKGPDKEIELQALIDAGKKAIEDGNVIGSGAPAVEAMSDILKTDINAAQRDIAWQAIQEENK